MSNNIIENIIKYNDEFVEKGEFKKYISDKVPNKKVVILSCMDTRLTELLPKAMNIKNGDAKIIKNAGAMISHPFGSIVRSIIVAVYEFGAEDVIVVGHHGCGMSNLDTKDIIRKIKERGVKDETIEMLKYSGINIEKWLKGFSSVEESVKESVKALENHPIMPKEIKVHGFIMDPKTGKLDIVINGYDNK